MLQKISIRGAREHNLKNIDVDIPRNQLVVITGLSGSGKSSLAFDTLYAEGQRRYVESLSAYARQFLQLMQKPDVDSIEGLSPAISIEQKTTSKNPRSTVGTVTELYDYIRLLFSRIGVPHSPATGLPIESQTASQIIQRIAQFPEDSKWLIIAPISENRKGEYKKEIDELRKAGFQRIKIDGTLYDIDDVPELKKNIKHTIDVVVDRIVMSDGIKNRIADSVETALKVGKGVLVLESPDGKERNLFSTLFACPISGFTLTNVEPQLFSFNSPQGACPTCDGLGAKLSFDVSRVIPNPRLSLRDGAIAPWSTKNSSGKNLFMYDYYAQLIDSLARALEFSTTTPFDDLHPSVQNIILHGSGRKEVQIEFSDGVRSLKTKKPFEGVLPNMERRWRDTDNETTREELSKYQLSQQCDSCHGYRLKPESLSVKINTKHIGEVCKNSIAEAYQWFNTLQLSDKEATIAERILREIHERLKFLNNVGLGYLSLSRTSGTLSGGESQRIRLASQIGSGLTGVLYVLDEPSIGLHQRDNDQLLATLIHLRDIGNTVVVVEHDEDAIRCADFVLDMGPGAGVHGGHIVAQGTPKDIMNNNDSVTGQYLKGLKCIPVPTRRRPVGKFGLTVKGAKANNLKNITASFPLGLMTCVTGVSGGGKSSLVIETLYKSLARYFYDARDTPGEHDGVDGLMRVDKVIDIDQSPIGRTPRSNPATYIGCFTTIREWFAGLPEAKARGYNPGRFSFNVKGGRCEACQGDGVIKIEMHFLPDVYVTCDECHGKRYNKETLDIRYKGKSIADILDMTVEEAVLFFDAHPNLKDKLHTLEKVGLGYIKVGQQATTLSGGEAQRVKLAKELSKRATGRTIFILDEPTTGLHFDDIKKLLEVLHSIADQGNTVIVIEHNLDVIKTADWIIDIGPEGGDGGGKIVAQGTPEDVVLVKESYTGKYLKPYLGQNGKCDAC